MRLASAGTVKAVSQSAALAFRESLHRLRTAKRIGIDLLEVAMRYLINARLKPEKKQALLDAIEDGTLGAGSIAGEEYVHDMQHARLTGDDTAQWVEVCYCATPLQEERPYWEEYFDLLSVKDAHARKNCRHENGTRFWACSECDCTKKLEARLAETGVGFLEHLGASHEK